jgi:hypothetical protein
VIEIDAAFAKYAPEPGATVIRECAGWTDDSADE